MGIVARPQAIICTDERQLDLIITPDVLAVVDDDIIADLKCEVQVIAGPQGPEYRTGVLEWRDLPSHRVCRILV